MGCNPPIFTSVKTGRPSLGLGFFFSSLKSHTLSTLYVTTLQNCQKAYQAKDLQKSWKFQYVPIDTCCTLFLNILKKILDTKNKLQVQLYARPKNWLQKSKHVNSAHRPSAWWDGIGSGFWRQDFWSQIRAPRIDAVHRVSPCGRIVVPPLI